MNEYKITMNSETMAVLMNALQSEIEFRDGTEPDLAANLKVVYQMMWTQWEKAIAE